MNKIQIKLIAMALALTLSVSVVIMSSYAWMVLSSNPAATGIQVVIGGGNTILIAPNIEFTDEATGKTYEIPGRFSDSINFGMYEEYDYLKEVGGLTPVSTSDGIDWFVAEGKHDQFLEHANLPKYVEVTDENDETSTIENPLIREGHFIYLDFWVVAPAGDYNLRISTGTKDSNGENSSGGSFVIDLPTPVLTTGENGITTASLTESEGSAAAAIRVGFLADPVTITDETMLIYKDKSGYYDKRFTALRGTYIEPNTVYYHSDSDNFVIYEPNADFHPGKEELSGSYVQTKPFVLGESGEAVPNGDIWNRLTVQLKSSWTANKDNGDRLFLEEYLNAELISNIKKWKDLSERQIMAEFLQGSLQGQFAQYVSKGEFIKYSTAENAGSLEGKIEADGTVSASAFANLTRMGATEDVKIIELERNIPQRIRMFIWLEGQDIDCAASARSASFAVNIEFAGGTE